MTLSQKIVKMAIKARRASYDMAQLSASVKKTVLLAMAKRLVAQTPVILKANARDLALAKSQSYSKALVDRLTLNEARVKAMAQGVVETAVLLDPIGEVLETIKRPNGLEIKKIRTPLGVVGIIFESRPNVTSDCAALCFKSGNAVILKGGREALYSNRAIYQVLRQVLIEHKMPVDAIQLIDSTDRAAVNELLKLDQWVDVIVPRGGESLIRFVVENTRIPVIKHYKGVCHVFVSQSANLDMAKAIILNAKTQKPGVCNAMETLLVDARIAKQFLPSMLKALSQAGCQIRADEVTRRLVKGLTKAQPTDWTTEYLDLILNVRVVDGLMAAIDHINTYGSHHSDAIVTTNKNEAKTFLAAVDSACVYVNASTRFTDGYEFGFGAEVGISTDKLHVRGPMALEGLTSYKYAIVGNGQIRR